ncbi:amidohydrolase [Nitrincola sp. MINF-07-Sa-05]|uniref:amidohydrolase n=1 Tax=Nitrincola salilacus TaxID=3400273 RepID=UPI003917BC45
MTKELTLALCQAAPLWQDGRGNLECFEQRLAGIEGVDLIILPEMFASGFTMDPRAVAQPMDGEAVGWMSRMARDKDAMLVGSLVIEDKGGYYNRLVWANPDGTLQWYDKKHLFSFAGEHSHYQAGHKRLMVDFRGWRLAGFVCFDLRFPTWCRNDKDCPYDAALFVASWPQVRAEHWNALLKARAIENQCYVVAVNRVGTDGNQVAYKGDSQVIDPQGQVECLLSCQDRVLVWQLRREAVRHTRETFAFLREADNAILV